MITNRSEWCWIDGQWTRWENATVHISTHALNYGSSAFEGIRAYEGSNGPNVFRLDAHVRRLMNSCRLLRMDTAPFGQLELSHACVELVERNQHGACYLRPIVFRAAGGLALNPLDVPVTAAIFSVEWGAYLGNDALENGVDAAISSWRRAAPDAMSPLGKIGGQYVINSLVTAEAQENGFHEGIMLDQDGYVAEGAGENLFVVENDVIVTPPLSSSILAGITRDSIVELAHDLGYTVEFERLTRDRLLLCDEVFFTGTAVEVTPVRSVDRVAIGAGRPGPITKHLQSEFFDIVSGRIADRRGWLHPTRAGTSRVA